MAMATNANYDMPAEAAIFNRTFQYLNDALGNKAFKRWNGHAFGGKFLLSVFEVLATGVAANVDALGQMGANARNTFIQTAAQNLWANEVFTANSGSGVRGTTRLPKLLPLGAPLLNPAA